MYNNKDIECCSCGVQIPSECISRNESSLIVSDASYSRGVTQFQLLQGYTSYHARLSLLCTEKILYNHGFSHSYDHDDDDAAGLSGHLLM